MCIRNQGPGIVQPASTWDANGQKSAHVLIVKTSFSDATWMPETQWERGAQFPSDLRHCLFIKVKKIHKVRQDGGMRKKLQNLSYVAFCCAVISVRPDVEIKSSPNVYNSCPNINPKQILLFYFPKKLPNIWAVFVKKLSKITFKNRPIWSHWRRSLLYVHRYVGWWSQYSRFWR